jgi:hypothetical protein
MASLAAILKSLGASPRRDGTFAMDCVSLQLNSIFGGDLEGDAVVVVAADAVSFKSPPELAACGKLWMPDVKDEDALCQAIGVALEDVRNQARAALATLRRLGFQSAMVAPDPRPHGHMSAAGVDVGVVVDHNGDLVVISVDGRPLAPDERRSLMAPDEATPAEAKQLATSMAKTHRSGATGAAAPSLSQEELNELQMALSDDDSGEGDAFDDDDDDDDDNEKTAAGVLPPSRGPTQAVDDDFDDDAGTLKLEFNAKEQLEMARHAKGGGPPPNAQRGVGALDSEFDDDIDVEPTATRPRGARVGAPTVVPRGPLSSDSEEDVLDALGRDDGPPAVDRFPGLSDDAAPFAGLPTSVSNVPMPSAAPTAAFVQPRGGPAASAGIFEDETTGAQRPPQVTDDDFDDGKTKALVVDEALLARLKLGDHAEQAPVAPKAHSPGASREGPFELPPTSTSAALQGMGPGVDAEAFGMNADGFDDQDNDGDQNEDDDGDDDIEVTASPAPAPKVKGPPRAARPEVDVGDLDASGFDDDDVVSDFHGQAPRVDDVARVAVRGEDLDGDLAGAFDGDDNADDGDSGDDVGGDAVGHPPVGDDDDEIASLQARRAMLLDELTQIDARLAALATRGLEGTNSNTATARSSRLPTEARLPPATPPPALHIDREPPRVGDSDEDSAESDTAATGGGFTSLPSLQSVDVHEVMGGRGGSQSLMDALDGDDDDDDFDSSTANGMQVPPSAGGEVAVEVASDDDDDDDDSEAATQAVPIMGHQERNARAAARVAENAAFAAAAAAVAVDDDDVDEGGVSLADLQGALQEMGVELGDGGATQVAASVMPFALKDDGDGDVFGSVSGADSLDQSQANEALSEEATRIRTVRPSSSIALVVEDARARERLRKHLVDRFSGLIEANDGRSAMQLKGIADVDAIVFVRPSQDDTNLASFTRLGGLPHRPRVLVISHDATFDALPAVDLRLPLGQRASEVAQQVLDGLERLGIQLNPGA